MQLWRKKIGSFQTYVWKNIYIMLEYAMPPLWLTGQPDAAKVKWLTSLSVVNGAWIKPHTYIISHCFLHIISKLDEFLRIRDKNKG